MSPYCNIFIVLLVACQGFSLPQAEFLGRTRSTRDLTCGDFVLDKCTIELEGFIETVKDLTEENCQRYCDVIYPGLCKFFIFDRKQRLCHLFSETMDDYTKTCVKVSGPKEPSLETCQSSPQPCEAFLEGYCRLEGNLIDNLEQIPDQKICQLACLFSTRCQYFLYDIETLNCELYDEETRDCDLMRGPPKPSLEECFGSTTTTLSTTTASDTTTDSPTTDTPPETTFIDQFLF